jgi:hypothetical protein
MRTQWKPVLGLALLAPLVGEYLLGNVTIDQLGALILLSPLYGGGALLIREVARRTGRGWPTILALGCAYGLVEAGVFDGSLFSVSYEGVDYDAVRIPVLGVSAFYGLQFVINHAVWSIGLPILLTESLTPRHRTTPWLGRVGLAGTAAVYLTGGLLIRYDSVRSGEIHVTWAQTTGVVLVALLVIIFALRRPVRGPRQPAGRGPRPWLAFLVALVASSAYLTLPANWLGVALTILITALAAVLAPRVRPGRPQVALAAGALLTYAWAGFLLTGLKHDADPVGFAGNAVFAAAALALVTVAFRRQPGVTAATQEVESSRKA